MLRGAKGREAVRALSPGGGGRCERVREAKSSPSHQGPSLGGRAWPEAYCQGTASRLNPCSGQEADRSSWDKRTGYGSKPEWRCTLSACSTDGIVPRFGHGRRARFSWSPPFSRERMRGEEAREPPALGTPKELCKTLMGLRCLRKWDREDTWGRPGEGRFLDHGIRSVQSLDRRESVR
jgi:hypothetical protein